MICPECGEQMTEGVLMGGRDGLCWFSMEYRKKHAMAPMSKKAVKESGMFKLRSGTLTTSNADVFHVCKRCGIMLAKLPQIKEEQS